MRHTVVLYWRSERANGTIVLDADTSTTASTSNRSGNGLVIEINSSFDFLRSSCSQYLGGGCQESGLAAVLPSIDLTR